MIDSGHSARQKRPYVRTALLLQGGGALGTYQQGVYQAVSEAGYEPDWFVGTSIGAIQGAILAGNRPEQRREKLQAFWDRITRPQLVAAPAPQHLARRLFNLTDAMETMALGQPGFFRPHPMPGAPWCSSVERQFSHYDTSPLKDTLESLVDFDRLNGSDVRLTVGAVEVETGRHVYFDSDHQVIDVRHIMASAALPPAFPYVEIDGKAYWDGGLLSNTPLSAVLDDNPRRSTLCFMVDLFEGNRGRRPINFDEVEDRRKDIIYSSRSEIQVEDHRRMHELRRAVTALYEQLPENKREDPEIAKLATLGCTTTMNLVRFVYTGQIYRSWAKDFTFLAQTLADHRQRGYQDGRRALAERQWESPAPPHAGIVVHDVAP